MARYKDEQCRICRREGQKLFLKGTRCYSDKCSVTRRNYAPGQHGQKRTKLSDYGTQLREKQKTRSFYGVGEKQFRKYFEMASNKKGITGTNLLQILESRLDNVVYRLGLGVSRPQARQIVTHGNIEVNGVKTDIASYLVKPGDVIAVRENRRDNSIIKANVEAGATRPIPEWLELDSKNLSAKVLRTVNREEIDLPVEEHLIVELYSKN
ncbi:MAG TPA: 30S ribosomal protein S4 [Candidatus Scatovivens faecipullorum]|nr:30S ribosomal protein S4 [Candidatus Scatovivens faecipullorum]